MGVFEGRGPPPGLLLGFPRGPPLDLPPLVLPLIPLHLAIIRPGPKAGSRRRRVVLFSSNLYARGSTIALALPFFLGIGMAVPWPLAGAGMAALPKPGAWMVRVKQVMGGIILATALYYGYETYSLFADRFVDAS